MAILSRNQRIFASELVKRTGLNPALVGSWIIAEEPAGASVPVGHNDQNWLNVGLTDSRWYGGAGGVHSSNPRQAGAATAEWLTGRQAVPGFGHAAPGIQAFAKTGGQPVGQQIQALQRSGWASSGYPTLPSIVQQNAGKYGINAHGVAGAPPDTVSPDSPQTRFALQTRNVLDQQGYQQAQREFQLGQILQNQRSPFQDFGPEGSARASNTLLSVLPDTAPTPDAYMRATTTLRKLAGGALPTHGLAVASGATGTAQRALSFAAHRLGTTETAGANRGPRIDAWERSFGTLAAPWCGIFVGKALQAAGVRGIDSRVASTAGIVDMARQGTGGFKGLVSARDVRPGDVVVWDPGSSGHTGIVERVKGDGTVVTIEGNTSNSVRREVHPSANAYYARPAYR